MATKQSYRALIESVYLKRIRMTTEIKKSLATKQDLAIGTGSISQSRNGQNVVVDQIDLIERQEVFNGHNTLADLMASPNVREGLTVQIRGRFASEDKGGSIWETVLTSSVTPNGFNIVQSTEEPLLSFALSGNLTASAWGAVGDGINDDSAALSALANYANGQLIILDGSVYKASIVLSGSTTRFNAKSVAQGGTRIKPLTTYMTLANLTYVRMTDIGLDGTLQLDGTDPGMFINNCTDVKIRGGDWGDTKRSILNIYRSSNVSVTGGYFHDSGTEGFGVSGVSYGSGILVTDSTDVLLEANQLDRIFQIALFVFNNETEIAKDVIIRGNTIKDSKGGVRCQPHDTNWTGVSNIIIEDNTIYNSGIDGIRANGTDLNVINNTVLGAAGVGIKTEGGENILLQGNIVKDCPSGGIKIVNSGTVPVKNWSALNNNLTRCGTASISISRATNSLALDNIKVCGNTITASAFRGIVVAGNATTYVMGLVVSDNIIHNADSQAIQIANAIDVIVSGNVVREPNQGTTQTPGAIYFRDCLSFVAHSNVVSDANALNAWGIYIEGTSSNHGQLISNDLRGSTQDAGTFLAATVGTNINVGQNLNNLYAGPADYSFTDQGTSRTLNVTTATTQQLGNVLGTLIEDLEAGRFFKVS
jgi:hypothetical protein